MFELTPESIDFLVTGMHVLVRNHQVATWIPCSVEVIYCGLTEREPQWIFTTVSSRVDEWNDIAYGHNYHDFIQHLRLRNNSVAHRGDAVLTRKHLIEALDAWQYVIA